MLKVLLVDDEPFMIDVLKSMIDWSSCGFLVAGEACDGEEALKIIQTCPLDIVVTDLKMPIMDGLELIRNAKAGNPGIHFAVISAYGEFHMVSEAFKLGAEEYLLKSEMTSEQMLTALTNINARIEKERAELKMKEEQKMLERQAFLHNQQLKHYIDQNQGAIREKMLKELIWGGEFAGRKRLRDFETLNIKINPLRKKLLMVQIDDYVRLESIVWEGDKMLLNFALLNIMEEVLQNFGTGDVFRDIPGQYVIICCFNDTVSEKVIEDKIYQIYMEIQRCVYQYLHVNTLWGASEISSGFKCLKDLYNHALQASRYCFVKGKGKLVNYLDLPKGGKLDLQSIHNRVERLRSLLIYADHEELLKAAGSFKLEGVVIPPENIEDVRELFNKYYLYIQDFAEELVVGDSLRELLQRYRGYLREYGDINELNAWIEEILKAAVLEMSDDSSIVKRAKKYIHKRYMEGISLNDVAGELGISGSYLSRIFSREVGCSILDYIAKVRIEVAINYMTNSDLKVYEVAEKVGYNNVEHFSRMFKKITGKSPREYAG